MERIFDAITEFLFMNLNCPTQPLKLKNKEKKVANESVNNKNFLDELCQFQKS
jgi:hypothetical protein